MSGQIRKILSWLAWPGLLAFSVWATDYGFTLGHPDLGFFVTYAILVTILLVLQRWMPHEPCWLERDGQLFADLMHSLVSTGAVQGVVGFTTMLAVTMGMSAVAGSWQGIWPRSWPMAAQVILGMAVLEFTLYWAHRLAHEWKPLWAFHAVHHSVGRLSVINNGRFHSVDAVKSVLPGLLLLLVLGAPIEVMTWQSALGAYIGMMTHANVAMRFGPLSLIFNTPELHRWHHSKDLREGNKNYGESLMLWDLLFGTWFNENRRPPVMIGIKEAMPPGFLHQQLWPFQQLRRAAWHSAASRSA